jgi:16S rRNA (uracil1498-N3)-methyltransferase
MGMHKFFVARDSFANDSVKIQGEDVKHMYRVLRLDSGDRISVNDCMGREYIGEIVDISKTEVNVKLIEEIDLNNESPLQISLYQGLPKSAKMDLIVQKATELGVKTITPIITDRVVVKSELGEFRKTDRWRRIALEACKQSKRSIIPQVETPIEFEELLSQLEGIDLIVVPYENEEGKGIKAMMKEISDINVKSAAVIIGPEGGFEEAEIEKLKVLGAKIITLGPRILRTETAGFVAVSMLMYELGDMGGVN